MTIKFNVGQVYSGRHMCDYDSVAHFIILARTAKTVKVTVHGKLVTRRVSEYCGREQFSPYGSYSMSMVIDANDPDLRTGVA